MSKAFFDELHIIDLMATPSLSRQSEYHTPLDIDKIRAAALISQNRHWDMQNERTKPTCPATVFFFPLWAGQVVVKYGIKRSRQPQGIRPCVLSALRLCVWLCDNYTILI